MALIRHRKSQTEIAYEEQRRVLDEEIAKLEELPKQLQLEIEESDQTLPPMEELAERERTRIFEEQAARGQVRNERRTQRKSVLLMFLLLTAIAATTFWFIEIAQR